MGMAAGKKRARHESLRFRGARATMGTMSHGVVEHEALKGLLREGTGEVFTDSCGHADDVKNSKEK